MERPRWMMRPRLPSPILPFDIVPSHVVTAAKRLFTRLRSSAHGTVELDEIGTRTGRFESNHAPLDRHSLHMEGEGALSKWPRVQEA